jgi:hypothetical protein
VIFAVEYHVVVVDDEFDHAGLPLVAAHQSVVIGTCGRPGGVG